MRDYSRGDRWVVAYARAVIRWRWWVLMGSLALAAGAIAGLSTLHYIGDYRYHFGPDNPELAAFDRIQNTYTKMDNVLFVVVPEEGEVFESGTLDALLTLTRESWQLPFSLRVDSLTNFQHTWSEGDDLVVEDLVEHAELSPQERARVRDVALEEPLLVRKLVAPNARAAAINVTLQFPDGGENQIATADEALDLAARIEATYPGHRVAVTGDLMLHHAMESSTREDLSTLVPLMYLVLVIAMVLFLRSFWGTLGTLVVTGLSATAGIGLAAWAGIPITPPSSNAATIILTIAIADGIHLLVALMKEMRHGLSREDALVESLRVNWQPIFLTSLTTVIGFVSLNFSDMPSFHDLGNTTALGVGIAWFLSVTFLPAFVAIVPYRVSAQRSGALSMEAFSEWLIRHQRRVLPATLAFALACAALVPQLELNDMFVNYFDTEMRFRRDTDFVRERLSGINQMHYSLAGSEDGSISEPSYLETVAAFQQWAEAQSDVDHVSALPDTMRRLNKNMHGDDEAYYRLPEQRDLAAQYLLLYEMSLPYGLDLNNQINIRKSATKVTATLSNISANELRDFDHRAKEWLVENAPVSMTGGGAGLSFMFANLSHRNIQSMIRGTILAFAAISLVLGISLWSFEYGLLSLVPNVIPTLIAFGIWAVTVGEMGIASGIVTAASLGIIVDATVHFLSKYLRARRERDASAEDAVRYALTTVGSALWVSFLILAAGFSVLAFSTFQMNAHFGLMIALTISAAIFADFLILPTLLMRVDRRSEGDTTMRHAATFLIALLFGLSLVAVQTARAETPEERGLAIAMEGDRRDLGFKDSTSTLKMILSNKQGETSERDLRLRVLEVPELTEGDKSLIVFDTPRDVKGTGFLSFTHINEPDDQWLYLPSLKRVKRISSKNKSGPFMGSEFAYEDMSSQEVAKYTYKFLRDEPCGELTCFVVERYPVYENSGYTRQIVWADHDEYRVLKTEYYDRKDSLLKTLVMTDYQQYLDQYWRAHSLFMENHQTGKTTRLLWSDFEFRTGVDEGDFDKNALKRIR